MAYETGGASGVNDLLNKLRVFLLAQGWTVNFFGARTDTTGNALLISKGGRHFGFMTMTVGGSTASPRDFFGAFQFPGPYNSGLGPHQQANSSPGTWSNNMLGPFQAYHFFAGVNAAGVDYCHIVVEVIPGSFRHNGIGQINKLGAITTGDYTYGSSWHYTTSHGLGINSYHTIPWDSIEHVSIAVGRGTVVRCDSDGISPKYGVFNSLPDVDGGLRQIIGGLFNNTGISGLGLAPSTLTGRSILLPIFGAVQRPAGYYSLLGGPPDLRFVNMANLLSGELITLGADTWKVFPIRRKDALPGAEYTGDWGYAYRVV